MKITEKGLRIIKDSEGLELKSYKCPAGKLTIGYGHTGVDVLPGMTINELAADIYLKMDCADAENAVNKYVKVPLNQNQFDALVSFIFNIGSGKFLNSSLLTKLNAGDYAGAAELFLMWTHGGGKELPGLVARRKKEKELFLTPMEAEP